MKYRRLASQTLILTTVVFLTSCQSSGKTGQPELGSDASQSVALQNGRLHELWRVSPRSKGGNSPVHRPISLAKVGEELFVADSRGRLVHVVNAETGEEIRTIGRAGEGPGAFEATLRCVRVDTTRGLVWVLDLRNISCFDLQGTFLRRFKNTSAYDLEIVPDGNLVAVGEATSRTGALALLSPEGEILRIFSAAPPFTKGTKFRWMYGTSSVCVLGETIWQAYSCFNQVKVFTSSGDSLGILTIPSEGLSRMHEKAVQRLAEGRAPANIINDIDFSGGEVWGLCRISKSLSDKPGGEDKQYIIYEMDTEGTLHGGYSTEFAQVPYDILISSDGNRRRLFIVDFLTFDVVALEFDPSRRAIGTSLDTVNIANYRQHE